MNGRTSTGIAAVIIIIIVVVVVVIVIVAVDQLLMAVRNPRAVVMGGHLAAVLLVDQSLLQIVDEGFPEAVGVMTGYVIRVGVVIVSARRVIDDSSGTQVAIHRMTIQSLMRS